ACAAILVEDALRDLLLEWMFFYRFLIDADAEAGTRVWLHQAALWFDSKSFLHHVLTPWHVVVDSLADDVARLREAEFQRGRGAHRPLRIVWRQRDAVRVRQCGDPSRCGEPAAMREVELADFAGTRVKQLAKRFEVRHPLAGCDGRGERCVD